MKMLALAFAMAMSFGTAHASIGSALKDCVNYPITNNVLTLEKSVQDNSSDTSLDIKCSNSTAKELFNQLDRFTSDTYYTYADGSKAIVRNNGSLKCWKNYLDTNGFSTDAHYCAIEIKVSNDLLKAVSL